jgi:protein SCO1/2
MYSKTCSLLILLSSCLLFACTNNKRQLPILGEPEISGNTKIYPVIAPFNLVNQDSQQVSNNSFADKVYIADFIFLSCPTICPKMTAAMLQVYQAYPQDERVALLSHTIDPERDTIPRLKTYADNLQVRSPKWQFVTGHQDTIIRLAEQSYFSTAYPDSTSPGGFTHSGGLLLIDKNRHIRGVYNGTKPAETERLIADIAVLLAEQF